VVANEDERRRGGIVDPVAGDWFPREALQLANLANPPLP